MITAPTAAHHDLVAAALAAGKPLFCEKPLAPTFDEVRASSARGGTLGRHRTGGLPLPLPPDHDRHRRTGATRVSSGPPMGYTLRDDQYWPTGDVVPGHSSWRSRPRPGRWRGAARALHPRRRRRVLALRPGSQGVGQHPPGVRIRRRGHGGGDGRARVGRDRHHPHRVQRGARARGAQVRGLLRARRASKPPPTSSWGRPRTACSCSDPTRPRAARPGGAAGAALRRAGIAAPRLRLLHVPGRPPLGALRAHAAWRPRPGFGDALRAHALVDAAYRAAESGHTVSVDPDP